MGTTTHTDKRVFISGSSMTTTVSSSFTVTAVPFLTDSTQRLIQTEVIVGPEFQHVARTYLEQVLTGVFVVDASTLSQTGNPGGRGRKRRRNAAFANSGRSAGEMDGCR
jgi:hypothetical protein